MDYDQLHQLSALKYRHSQQQMAEILTRENALRAELIKLRGHIVETHALPPEQSQMRAIGADVIWLRWVTRTQNRLNIELAQVMAQKEGHIARHRKAFGKMQVSRSLAEGERERRLNALRDHALARAIDQTVI
jgi:hypothetical protein